MAADVATAAPPELARPARLLEAEALLLLGHDEEAARRLTALPVLREVPLAAKRAELLYRSGRDREAQRQLDELLRQADGRAAAIEVLQRVDRYGDSIPLLEDLLADDPGAVQAMFMLGAAYERTGQLPEAVGVFQDLIAREPDFHLALNYLGYMWADHGENLGEALELIERALELDPDNAAYLDSLGWVYHRLGRHREALGELAKAAAAVPDDATIQEHLGDVHRALGDVEEARAAYRRAVELEDENLREVRRKLAELEERR
jgi:tetratricopeptide (TPR) repeat protein